MNISRYGQKYAEYPVEYSEIFETYNSSQAFEEDVGFAGFGLIPIKNEGSNITYEDAEQGFVTRYTHVTYGLGFVITREAYEDGIAVSKALARAESLAFSVRQTKENVAANVLNRAFTNTYTGGDGKELCATDHPHKKGGTWQNEPTTDADISETALEQALLDIADFTTDSGLKIAVRARKIIVPPELQFDVSRLIDNPNRPDTANRDINAMVKAGSFPEGWSVNHYLTDADAWFIKTDCPHGLKHFQRREPEFSSDNTFDSENAKFKSTDRYSFGWTDPRGIYGCTGAN